MLDAAKRNRKSSVEELQKAEGFLKEAEKRWEVIEIDAASTDVPKNDGGSKKKRKVSPSPSGANNGVNSGAASADSSATSVSTNDVCVSGSEIAEVNGTYSYTSEGWYKKKGRWRGAETTFYIREKGGTRNAWYVDVDVEHEYTRQKLYAHWSGFRLTWQPPESGWHQMMIVPPYFYWPAPGFRVQTL